MRSLLPILLLLLAAGGGCTEEFEPVGDPALDAAAAHVRSLEANCSPVALTEFDGR